MAQYKTKRKSSVLLNSFRESLDSAMKDKVSPTKAKNELIQKPKRSKFGNVKTTFDGIVFDSKREALHWQLLKMREAIGEISELKRQVRYDLHVREIKVCSYVADFLYFECFKWVVADSKGVKTPMYNLKKKMLAAEYGLEIVEM